MSERMLSHYRAIAKLGYGGMAEVRLALAQRAGGFNKLLVLKLLREELAADQEFLEMFLAEARIAALLSHPNIVQTNEVGTEGGRHFIAMEYLEGQPLSSLLNRVGRKNLPLELHVFVLSQMLHGLHYAHELTDLDGKSMGLIHRDVSPQNVFLTYSGQVKLLDFGIAKVAGAAGLTKAGGLKGKVGYMAPEQARMSTTLDRRADIFAVGVMLWEALTHRRFVSSKENEVETLQRRLTNQDAKLADVAPDADPKLAAICNKALEFNPDDRWPDALSFAEALEEWLPRSKTAIEKALGSLLVDTFREERSKIRRVIEEESAKPVSEELSSHQLRDLMSTLDGASTSFDSDVYAGLAKSEPEPERKPRTLQWTVAALVLACIAGGGGLYLRNARQDGARRAEAEAESKRHVSSNVAVRIRANPQAATVTVDDGAPSAAPYDRTVPKDNALHKVRVVADGYEPAERKVSFGSDVDLDVTLRKTSTNSEPQATAAVIATARPARPALPAPTPRPKTTKIQPDPVPTPASQATTTKARHSIDETDPYGHP